MAEPRGRGRKSGERDAPERISRMRTAEAPPRFGSAGAGDCANIVEHSAAVILEAATHWLEVVVVDGNHEYYDTSDGGRALDAAYRILDRRSREPNAPRILWNTRDIERSRFRFADAGIAEQD